MCRTKIYERLQILLTWIQRTRIHKTNLCKAHCKHGNKNNGNPLTKLLLCSVKKYTSSDKHIRGHKRFHTAGKIWDESETESENERAVWAEPEEMIWIDYVDRVWLTLGAKKNRNTRCHLSKKMLPRATWSHFIQSFGQILIYAVWLLRESLSLALWSLRLGRDCLTKSVFCFLMSFIKLVVRSKSTTHYIFLRKFYLTWNKFSLFKKNDQWFFIKFREKLKLKWYKCFKVKRMYG